MRRLRAAEDGDLLVPVCRIDQDESIYPTVLSIHPECICCGMRGIRIKRPLLHLGHDLRSMPVSSYMMSFQFGLAAMSSSAEPAFSFAFAGEFESG